MSTPHDNHSVDPARTGVQRLRDGLATSAALGATITVVAGTVLINGQPVGAVPSGGPTVVTSLDDEINSDETTSLREALENARFNAGADTITFAPSLFVGGPAVIEINRSLEVNSHDVTINGPGADQLTIRAVDDASDPENIDALYFYGDVAVSISNISIEATGDGIEAHGEYFGEGLPLASVTLSGVDVSAHARAIFVSRVSGDVTVAGSSLSNVADSGGWYGQSIIEVYSVDGDVVITDVEIIEAESGLAIDPFGPSSTPRRGLNVSDADFVTLTNLTTDTSDAGARLNGIHSDVEISDSNITSAFEGVDVRYAGDLTISDTNITIDNDGMVVDRFGPGGAGGINASYLGVVSLDGVTLTGGSLGVSYASMLDIARSTITEARYGAIAANGVPLAMTDSTISNSDAMYGNALIDAAGDGRYGPGRCLDMCLDSPSADGPVEDAPSDSDVVISNSTITGNTVGFGGAIVRSSDRYSGRPFSDSIDETPDAADVSIQSSTIAGNMVGDDFGPGLDSLGESGVTVVQAVTLSVDHSIITDNDGMSVLGNEMLARFADASALGTKDSIDDPFVGLTAEHSILPAANGPAEGTNIFTDDPGLADLADNGGSTETMLPAIDSPAVDAGAATSALPFDQRGEVRPSGESNDIGAVERQASTVSISAAPASVAEADGTVAITITRTGDGEGDGVGSVRVSTSDGTATAGADYTALDQVVTLPADQATTTVDIAIATDADIEGDETFVVTLSDADDVSIDVGSVEVTITDSTTPPTTVPDATTTTTTVPDTTTTEPAVTTTTEPPLTLNGDDPQPVAGGSQSSFTVTVEQGDDEDVDVSAKSSDPSLLQVVSVTKKGQGNAFTRGSAALTEVQYEVRVQAAVGGSGTATITVTAEGDSGSATQDFQIEVSSQTLPATGANTTQRTGLIGALLLGFGFMTSLVSRRRRA